MRVPLERVERELDKLWEEEAKKSGASHVALLTVVALVSDRALLARATDVLARVSRAHPSRCITAVWEPEGLRGTATDPALTATIDLQRVPGHAPSGETILLEARGAARDWLPENADRLLLPDLPVCVWWVGDLPDRDDLFERTIRFASAVVVDSAESDLRDLEKIARLLVPGRGAYALADLTWVRLRPLQDLVARFFDDPAVRPYLEGIDDIRIAYSPRPGDRDAASAEAGLFLGWMATALGFGTDTPRWVRSEQRAEVSLSKPRMPGRAGGRVTACFERDPRDGVPAGAITRIVLRSGDAHFDVERLKDDPNHFRWSCDVPGVVVPSQNLRVRVHEESYYFIRYLERPVRDPLLEASIGVASAIVRPVAPRFTGRPPPAR